MGALAPDAQRLTLSISNVPQTVTANDLLAYLESHIGKDSIFAIEILTDHKNWKSRGYGRVQFTSTTTKNKALDLCLSNALVVRSQTVKLTETYDDIVPRPIRSSNRVDNGVLRVGFLSEKDVFCCLEKWEGVRGWVMPERRRVEFWVWVGDDECFKVDVRFDDVLESVGLFNEEKGSGVLLKLRYAPKIFQKISQPNIASKFANNRYCICKDDFNFLWVRTTDFSARKSIGLSTAFYWEIGEGLEVSDVFTSFPYYQENNEGLDIEDWQHFCPATEVVPVVDCGSNPVLPFEIQFQLSSLVHMQKISFDAADADLFEELSLLNTETASMILQGMHKLDSTCYDPVTFVKLQSHVAGRNLKKQPSPTRKSLKNNNVMQCYRALITPTKIYCLGPELETSNYVVKHFAAYASDFIRVTFVEEDWSKLPAGAISTSIHEGIFAKPFRTRIYHRILSVLRDGIQIGNKRYEFLAFSASQLRSNSVWMFASNDNVKAEDVREWMGSFKKIRSISKCAARMGQLFSSSLQTYVVPPQETESIPDIEVTSDGISYCFSDGIGKISLSFATDVAQKLGLKHTPSAFQIRYGGYKGVVAVDRDSSHKLSLRGSMRKFESDNWMLNVTRCSDSMPCYLNREVVSLLSTLGVKDEIFVGLQQEQLKLLGRMLHNREAALDVLENLTWAGTKNILVKMLLQGYEPNSEPFLSMMIQAYHENLLTELRSRCRVFVPKGRILIGCLDETGILNYGQVYVRITMTKSELQSIDQAVFRKVDDTTSVLMGKVVVTKNPCLHPGDVRVLDAVYDVVLEEKGLMDCILFPQKGERPHPNECSGGDLDGDQFFISWDEGLIPCETVAPMDYVGRRPRIMDHDVTLEEIQKFFVDYMINDTLGAISTAHLVHADCEPEKARSKKCLQLASLHSMAVDFAKTGAPAEMPRYLKPKEFPDFMERTDKPMYTSEGPLGKLYRAVLDSTTQRRSKFIWSKEIAEAAYDHDLEADGFKDFLEPACNHRDMYAEKVNDLMIYFEAKDEDEILTGNLRSKPMYLQRDNRRYGDTKDRILIAIRNLQNEAKEWFESSCTPKDQSSLASAWYHVTYHPTYHNESKNCLSFPWIVGDTLLTIKTANSKMEN